MNLVSNAMDAMPNGGELNVEILPVSLDQEFIEIHGYGKAGAYVLLSVSDSGVGMDKGTQSRIFEPFFTTKQQGKGTGLGLSMAYGIVKKHDGFINVYSEPGTGTIFKIYLPRVLSTAQVDKMETREVSPLRGGTETILVVEDDSALLRLSTNVLATMAIALSKRWTARTRWTNSSNTGTASISLSSTQSCRKKRHRGMSGNENGATQPESGLFKRVLEGHFCGGQCA